MGPLNQFNSTFQADTSLIGCLHSEIVQLLRKFLGKFVQTKIIVSSCDITTVEYNKPENRHLYDLLAVGMGTQKYLHKNPDIPTETFQRFFCGVVIFYTEMTDKMIKKFPFNNKMLQQLGFVNPAFPVEADPESTMVHTGICGRQVNTFLTAFNIPPVSKT